MYVRIKSSLIILLLICVSAKGQSLDFGFSGGMNFSTHAEKYRSVGSVGLTPNYTGGYQIGIFISQEVSDILLIRFEPTFIKLGARYNESFSIQGSEVFTESWTKLLYMQFPLLAQCSADIFGDLSVSSNTRYYLTGGVFMGYLLDAQFKGKNIFVDPFANVSPPKYFSRDVMISYSKYDFGTMLGLGLEYDHKIGFETRIQHTMIQSYKSEPLYEPKNIAITFSLLYHL